MRGIAARRPLVLLAALAAVCAIAAGPSTFARLAFMAGSPRLALPFIDDEAARAAALYDLGRYGEADDAFRAIGRSVTYNRANTLAATGDYELSVAYYDAVLFADRFDEGARTTGRSWRPSSPRSSARRWGAGASGRS